VEVYSGETVTFRLDASAGVVILRVWPGWRLDQLYPVHTRDTSYFQESRREKMGTPHSGAWRRHERNRERRSGVGIFGSTSELRYGAPACTLTANTPSN
jgi:hypothetical protein